MDKVTLVSPEGEEVTLDNIEFVVENYKRLGWKEKKASRKGKAQAPKTAEPDAPAGESEEDGGNEDEG